MLEQLQYTQFLIEFCELSNGEQLYENKLISYQCSSKLFTLCTALSVSLCLYFYIEKLQNSLVTVDVRSQINWIERRLYKAFYNVSAREFSVSCNIEIV